MDDTDEFLRPQQSLIVPYFFRCEDIGDHKYSMLFGYQSAEQNKGGSREYARVTPSNQNVPEITWR
ncbi:hypothetical protein SARC_08954 [Sphaeroforma arctica JP610]|uniref:Uncharacterized protein n=1 Tax=Sphaeroforma arctica JP610 TaxID=667725 RepID=A0A0L0FPJ1_9EUKA|nr:hypothetical protein SARC_08954 [Sphaeroforma arctica JP610]KNC78624.1 hypothetical protein SARC_08954 [Sphaeroforma arctica JP610]|eukprot:XP_014152526.1 hypothetical protein SARC_08954 [Sphaeroforma arctica JP610]